MRNVHSSNAVYAPVIVAEIVHAGPAVTSDRLHLLERHLRRHRHPVEVTLIKSVADFANSGNTQVPQVRVVVLDVLEKLAGGVRSVGAMPARA